MHGRSRPTGGLEGIAGRAFYQGRQGYLVVRRVRLVTPSACSARTPKAAKRTEDVELVESWVVPVAGEL
jgi:hypothetical protein